MSRRYIRNVSADSADGGLESLGNPPTGTASTQRHSEDLEPVLKLR